MTPRKHVRINNEPEHQELKLPRFTTMVSNTKQRKGLNGDFGRETPSTTGTTANIHTWFAGWHLDDGFSVPETNKFVDILRKLKWTATDVRERSVNQLLDDLRACGYTFEWAPRLAGDIQRAITLKVSSVQPLRIVPSELFYQTAILDSQALDC